MSNNCLPIVSTLMGPSNRPTTIALLERITVAVESIEHRLAMTATLAGLPQRDDVEQPFDQISLRACAALAGISESTLRRAIKSGRLTAYDIGQGNRRPTYRIKRADLEAYLERGRAAACDVPSVPRIRIKKASRHFD